MIILDPESNLIFMKRRSKLILLMIGSILFTSSCVKTRKCECNTYSIAYYPDGSAYDNIETSSFTVKGSNSENKTQCDVIKSNQPQTNGYTTECSVKQ